MIQKNPFLKYLIKDKKEDVFHSSVYAKVQSGEGIGAASSQGYQVRVNLAQNRTRVRGYGDSEIMTGVKKNAPRAKVYTPPENSGAGMGMGAGRIGADASKRAVAPGVKKAGISIKK